MSDFKFFNVVPYNPGREEETARDLIEFYQRTGIPRVLYSLSYHPQGGNAMVKAERLTASFRRLKELLSVEPGIQCGVLIQSILGHVIAAEVEQEPWTKVITHNSKQEGKGTRFCYIGIPNFHRYSVCLMLTATRFLSLILILLSVAQAVASSGLCNMS